MIFRTSIDALSSCKPVCSKQQSGAIGSVLHIAVLSAHMLLNTAELASLVDSCFCMSLPHVLRLSLLKMLWPPTSLEGGLWTASSDSKYNEFAVSFLLLLPRSANRGGGIELFILAKYYGRQIDAYDIQTKRCDRYGEHDGHSERVMLIYDGLHYDAMAVAAFDGAPDDLDITVLQVGV